MGLSRPEYWSGLPFSPPGNLPDPGIKLSLESPALQVDSFTTSATWEAQTDCVFAPLHSLLLLLLSHFSRVRPCATP